MSLINQMLQDLDKRGAHPSSADAVHAHVSPVDEVLRTSYAWLSVCIIVAVVAILAWWQLQRSHSGTIIAPPALRTTAEKNATSPITPLPSSAAFPPRYPIAVDTLPSTKPISAAQVQLKLSSGLSYQALPALPALPTSIEQIKPQNVLEKPRSASLPFADPVPQPTAGSGTLTEVRKITEQNTGSVRTVKEITPQQQAESDYRQAMQLQQQGRTAEAIALLEQLLRTAPEHNAARQMLIGLLVENKQLDDAIHYLQQTLNQDLNQASNAMTLARLQVEKGNVSGAIDTLQRTLPAANERADYLAFLAALQQRTAHHKEAIDLYQRALKRAPQNGLWWMGMAISLQADGRNNDALGAFTHAKTSNGLSADLMIFVEQKIAQLQK